MKGLIALLLCTSCAIENCERSYIFSGSIKDANGSSLENVGVNISEMEFAKSDLNGEYIYYGKVTRATYVDEVLVFKKDGYSTIKSEPILNIEAGKDVCGVAVIKRNIIMP